MDLKYLRLPKMVIITQVESKLTNLVVVWWLEVPMKFNSLSQSIMTQLNQFFAPIICSSSFIMGSYIIGKSVENHGKSIQYGMKNIASDTIENLDYTIFPPFIKVKKNHGEVNESIVSLK